MLKNLQINTLVNMSYFLIIILFTILAITSYLQILKIEADSERVTSLRAPTVKASASLNIALNKSLAALRGWMLIGEERFLRDRRDSWQSIRKEEDKLRSLSTHWTNPKNVERLSTAVNLLNQLENEQASIELIAHNPENIRSSEILLNKAIPIASSVIGSITTMIDFSKSRKASTERLELLSEMADFRGSFALSLADIRAFLLSGDIRFKDSFAVHWLRNKKSYKNLNSLAKHMTYFEKGKLDEIKKLRESFTPLPKKMFSSRQSEDWNQANYLLKTTAVLTANKLVSIFEQMVSNQNFLLEEDAYLINKQVEKMKIFQLVFLFFFLIITLFLSKIINKKYHVFSKNLSIRKSLVDQNVLMADLDKDGNVMSISNALCRSLGGIKRDFIGKSNDFFIPRDENSDLLNTILKTLLTGQTWQGEFKRYNADGKEIWYYSTIFPIGKEDDGEDGEKFHNILEDITNHKLLEEMAVTDTLTSLYNRRKFDEVIEHEIKLAKRKHTHLTLSIIDIDFFKKYNDNYGHPEGDIALKRTASAIRACLSRPDDYVFRLGGEEFGVLFNSLNEKETKEILEHIRLNVEQLKIEHSHNNVSDYVTISIGAKVYHANEIVDKDSFYNEADRYLYAAKKVRNTVIVG